MTKLTDIFDEKMYEKENCNKDTIKSVKKFRTLFMVFGVLFLMIAVTTPILLTIGEESTLLFKKPTQSEQNDLAPATPFTIEINASIVKTNLTEFYIRFLGIALYTDEAVEKLGDNITEFYMAMFTSKMRFNGGLFPINYRTYNFSRQNYTSPFIFIDQGYTEYEMDIDVDTQIRVPRSDIFGKYYFMPIFLLYFKYLKNNVTEDQSVFVMEDLKTKEQLTANKLGYGTTEIQIDSIKYNNTIQEYCLSKKGILTSIEELKFPITATFSYKNNPFAFTTSPKNI